MIVRHAGLVPRIAPASPLWTGVVRLVATIDVGALSLRLNLLSALCGAVAVFALYHIIVDVIRGAIMPSVVDDVRAQAAACLAGTTAACFLTFCIPFWTVCNRAHVASFDVMLVLLVAWLYLVYLRTDRDRYGFLWALLYGLGAVEHVAFVALAPLCGGHILLHLWEQERLSARRVVFLLLLGLTGWSILFLVVWQFHESPGYELRGYGSYWQIIWYGSRDQYWALTRSLPKRGWLVALIVTVVPWLTCLAVGKRGLNEERDWSYYVLHVVMTALVVCVLFDVYWVRSLVRSGDAVMHYVLTASVYGYLSAYWFLLAGAWRPTEGNRLPAFIHSWLPRALACLMLGGVACGGYRNVGASGTTRSALVNWYVGTVLDSVGNCQWLVTGGKLDNNIAIVAYERGNPIRLLNRQAGDNVIYLRYIDGLFESPRLRNAARIGIVPLFQEWFLVESNAVHQVAVLEEPDLWIGVGVTPLPNKAVFLGRRDISPDSLEEHYNAHRKFWSDALGVIKRHGPATPGDGEPAHLILARLSKVANNLGVTMEQHHRQADAFESYAMAREFLPDNASALLNQIRIIEQGLETDREPEIRARLKVWLRDKKKYHAWVLAKRYGYVYDAEVLSELGMSWARSGSPGRAVAGLNKMLSMLPSDARAPLKGVVAGLQSARRKDEESAALYYELLVENPKNTLALIGAARLAGRKGDEKEAERLWKRAEEAGTPRSTIAVERATMFILNGNVERAKKLVNDAVEVKPRFTRAWLLRAEIAIQEQDDDKVDECIKHLEDLPNGCVLALVVSGRRAFVQNDFRSALRDFEKALAMSGDNPDILERCLQLDFLVGARRGVREHSRRLLGIEPDNSLGNYAMGFLLLQEGEPELAEDCLRRSIQTAKSPEALNDLAWLLQARGEHREALGLAREAVSLGPAMYNAWDTLGVILLKLSRLEEAEAALEKAITISQGSDPAVLINMAELQFVKGDRKKARELVSTLPEESHLLNREYREKLSDLKRRL